MLLSERPCSVFFLFFFNDTATTEIYTLSLHDALPISHGRHAVAFEVAANLERPDRARVGGRECNGSLRLRGRWLRLRREIRLRHWIDAIALGPAEKQVGLLSRTGWRAWHGGDGGGGQGRGARPLL